MEIQKNGEKFSQSQVWNLLVFDLEGNLITKLNELEISFFDFDKFRIVVKSSMLDVNLIKFMGRKLHHECNTTDYEKITAGERKYNNWISFGDTRTRCKIIVNGKARESVSFNDYEYSIQVPKADIHFGDMFQSSNSGDPSMLTLIVEMNVFNDRGDRYILQI